MSTAFRTMSGQGFTLGSSISSTQTTILLTSFLVPVSGTPITMATMGTIIAYGTLAPGTSTAELISFTGVTQNADGTATLTGVTRGLDKEYPYTTVIGFKQPHAGQTIFILSDAPQVFNEYPAKRNDETITGQFTFPQSGTASAAVAGAVYAAPTNDIEFATKKYVDEIAIAGSPNASTTVKGIGKVSVAPVSPTSPIFVGQNDPKVPPVDTSTMTSGQVAALLGNNTDVAVGSGNKYVTQTGLQHNTEKYVADASGSSTAYTATLSPSITSLSTGMTVGVLIGSGNSSTAPTININNLGAKTIVKRVSTALAVGDIATSMVAGLVYNGSQFVLQNPAIQLLQTVASNNAKLSANTVRSVSTATFTIVKSFTVNSYGPVRFTTDIKTDTGTATWELRDERGTVIATNNTASTTYVTQTADFYSYPGMVLNEYIKSSTGTVSVQNVKIMYDETPYTIGAVITD